MISTTDQARTGYPSHAYDVVVVGAGNAALCAALAAADEGTRVLVLERAPKSERGGNSTFTAGAMRVVYDGLDDIRKLVPSLSEDAAATVDFGAYSCEQFQSDMMRLTNGRSDPAMLDTLVSRSFETLLWMRSKNVPFVPLYDRQSYEIDGKRRFWGGLTIGTDNGGFGLVDALTASAEAAGVDIWYEARATGLRMSLSGAVEGVSVRTRGSRVEVTARAVVLACGGFEANTEMRTRYMGPGWDIAKVRGSRFNTGDGHKMALAADAMPFGQWSGGHAVFWEKDAPDFGDLQVSNKYSKLSYPLGIVVNANGERFVDEGADFRNYTYARYGREVLKQPGSFAWQVFDAKTVPLLQVDYRMPHVQKATADTLEELAAQMDGVDAERFLTTVSTFNTAIDTDVPFNPTVKDGCRTRGLAIDKTNWAVPLDTPPFEAYAVTCGITFTFGGVRIIPERAEVLDTDGHPIPNLYAAGELVGGLFYDNYPGGSGLTAGAVFGRIAGTHAGRRAQSKTTITS